MNSSLLNQPRIACVRIGICALLGTTASFGATTEAKAEFDDPVVTDLSIDEPNTRKLTPAEATLQTAEFNYRARRLSAAMEQFGMIAAMQDHPFAWLRVGNICHRRGDASGAMDAYQRAARAASRSPEFAQLGHRAIMNQALLGLDQAQLALESLGMKTAATTDKQWVDEMQLRVGELSAAIADVAVQDANR